MTDHKQFTQQQIRELARELSDTINPLNGAGYELYDRAIAAFGKQAWDAITSSRLTRLQVLQLIELGTRAWATEGVDKDKLLRMLIEPGLKKYATGYPYTCDETLGNTLEPSTVGNVTYLPFGRSKNAKAGGAS